MLDIADDGTFRVVFINDSFTALPFVAFT